MPPGFSSLSAAKGACNLTAFIRLPATIRCALLAVAFSLSTSSCSNYATATTRHLTYHSHTATGQIISRKLHHPSSDPLAQIGGYPYTAATAPAALPPHP